MKINEVKNGMRVKITKLGSTLGYMVKDKHIEARTLGSIGVLDGQIPGHGGEIWWIQHGETPSKLSSVGAYAYDEFEEIDIAGNIVVDGIHTNILNLGFDTFDASKLVLSVSSSRNVVFHTDQGDIVIDRESGKIILPPNVDYDKAAQDFWTAVTKVIIEAKKIETDLFPQRS